jgi:asparagine synthase (glutamine-hydrolysing)
MCGIAGGIALSLDARPDQDRVRAMSRLLSHRGPDGEGLWISPSGRACLAHRRLSVIDIEGGGQPFLDDAGSSAIVFNGEIYNYLELRRALERKGERFRTKSDTEVLLRLLAREGAEGIRRLRGMFAFVLWDDERGTLLAARDRVGKKPLFTAMENDCLYFASSLKALRRSAARTYVINADVLSEYLALGYIPSPRTIYREVQKLPAATLARSVGGTLALHRYWDLAKDSETFSGSYAQALDRLEDLLQTAVAIRLRSDVPLGILLSGGIDSSLVAAIAGRHAGRAVNAYSIGFAESRFDESSHAAAVARHLGIPHHTLRGQIGLADLIPRIVDHFGEPYADSSALPTWALSAYIRQHVTVALGGDGGDEGFAGYEWYRTALRLESLARKVPAGLTRRAAHLATAVARRLEEPSRIRRVARGLAFLSRDDFGQRFAALRSCFGPEEAAMLYRGELLDQHRTHQDALQHLYRAFSRAEGSFLRRMRYTDVESYLADDLMPKIDVMSMAHGLELRAPLLDQDVLRFAFSLPDNFLADERGGKRMLRDLLDRYVPRALVDRPKQGFSVPLPLWLRGELRPRIERVARSERLRSLGILDLDAIHRLALEHSSGARNHGERLYSLFVLDEWLAAEDAPPAPERSHLSVPA